MLINNRGQGWEIGLSSWSMFLGLLKKSVNLQAWGSKMSIRGVMAYIITWARGLVSTVVLSPLHWVTIVIAHLPHPHNSIGYKDEKNHKGLHKCCGLSILFLKPCQNLHTTNEQWQLNLPKPQNSPNVKTTPSSL
jgi:hypothetical protein